jgi:DNA-binding response OmpR family regulator
MKVLVLDDEPHRHQIFREHLSAEDVRYVWTAVEAVQALLSEHFDLVLLDHDLGLDDPGDGCDVAQSLVETPNSEAIVIVHSDNPYGAHRMLQVLRNARSIPWHDQRNLWASIEAVRVSVERQP